MLENLEVTIYSNSKPKNVKHGLASPLAQTGMRQPHDVNLPSVILRRKKKGIHIKWLSQNLTEQEMEVPGSQNATTSVFIRAAQDVYDALDWGLNQRVSERDDFDISGCLDWVKSAQNHAPKNDSDLRSLLSIRSEKYLHLVRTKDFHKRINVDWSTMHENAAHLLYHPDLWNESDARMPHGNELGKGILEHFDFYQEKSLEEVLLNFGLKPYETATTYNNKVKALQVELSLVFGHIKKRGCVQEKFVDDLIRRMQIESRNSKSFWAHRSRHGTNSHFDWMYHFLGHPGPLGSHRSRPESRH